MGRPRRLPASPSDPALTIAYWQSRKHGRRERAQEAASNYDALTLSVLTDALRQFDRGRDRAAPDGQRRSTGRVYTAGIAHWVTFAREEGADLLMPDPDDAVSWVRHMENGSEDTPAFQASTVSGYVAGVRWLYAALRRIGASTADPLADVRLRPDERSSWDKRAAYPLVDVQALIETAVQEGELALALAISLGADAGLRASEIVSARFKHFDLAGRMLDIPRAKGDQERRVALLPRAVERFEALLPETARGRPEYVRHLLPNREERIYPYTSVWLRRALRRLCALAGVTYCGVHSLRHTHGQHLADQGVPLQTVAAQLGHRNVLTTQIYVKLNRPEAVHEYEKALNAVYDDTKSQSGSD